MTHQEKLTFWRLLLAIATTFAITMALLPHPPAIPVGDKWQHMAAFGTLTVLAILAYPKASLLQVGERLSFLGALIEVAQSLPVLHRDCDIMDWVADTAIIIIVLVTVLVFRHFRGDYSTWP